MPAGTRDLCYKRLLVIIILTPVKMWHELLH